MRSAALLIAHGSLDPAGTAEAEQFAGLLSEQLALPVEPCFLELSSPPVIDALQTCLSRGAERIVALPLFLAEASHHADDLPNLLSWIAQRHPSVSFVYAESPGKQPALLDALAARAAEAESRQPRKVPHAETALLLVDYGSAEAEHNAEAAGLARLLYERGDYGWVELAFYSAAKPNIRAGVERCVRLGARRVILVPYLLFADRVTRFIAGQLPKLQRCYPELELLLAEHLGLHPQLVAAVQQCYVEALNGPVTVRSSSHSHSHSHATAVQSILPPRYQGNVTVSAAPMAAADLVFDADGRVAWDRIWGGDDPNHPFCELALAGGPPHRGELLEPPPPEEVRANRAQYNQVLMELLRGITMTTGLKGIISRAPGWIGVQCDSEDMAIWLLRAILVENVSARREGSILFLPAGPQFRLKYEIKNVITVLAKTHHYWQEHLS